MWFYQTFLMEVFVLCTGKAARCKRYSFLNNLLRGFKTFTKAVVGGCVRSYQDRLLTIQGLNNKAERLIQLGKHSGTDRRHAVFGFLILRKRNPKERFTHKLIVNKGIIQSRCARICHRPRTTRSPSGTWAAPDHRQVWQLTEDWTRLLNGSSFRWGAPF